MKCAREKIINTYERRYDGINRKLYRLRSVRASSGKPDSYLKCCVRRLWHGEIGGEHTVYTPECDSSPHTNQHD